MQTSSLPSRKIDATLPMQVQRLAVREREVAAIVYANGATTANEVQKRLSDEISNGAVRSMLVRLVAKGILARRWGKRGRGQNFIYTPAITSDDLKHDAIKRVTVEYFNGSLVDVAITVADLLRVANGVSAQAILRPPF